MRTSIFYSVTGLLWAMVLFAACSKESLMTYNATDNIYFDYRQGANPATNVVGTLVDSLAYSFAYSDASVAEAIVPIPITVTGLPQTTDRTCHVIVDAGATALPEKHYEIPTFVMHAGRLRDTLFLKLKRTPELKDSKINMTLRLQANGQFDTLISSRLSLGMATPVLAFRVSVTDELTQGPSWSTFSTFFGTFSKKKMLLMHDIVGLPLDFWAVTSVTGDMRAAATYYAATMSRYLKEQVLSGNTIYEQDGVTLMKMGADFL